MGAQGRDRLSRLSDDLVRPAVSSPCHQRQSGGRRATGKCEGRAHRQTRDQPIRRRRSSMVPRPDPQSLESAPGCSGFVIGLRLGDRRRTRRLLDRDRYGRVSRHGCMQLCWLLDTVGPICRSADDCGLVFAAIHGADPRDAVSVDRPYVWPSSRDISTIRVGYSPENRKDEDREELRVLRELGVKLVPIRKTKLLDDYGLTFELIEAVVAMESATSFDELTRRGEPKGVHGWPRYWAAGHLLSAVDYLKFSRLRAILMERLEKLMQTIDIYFGDELVLYTNLAGHPGLAFPKKFEKDNDFLVPRPQF